MRGNVNSFSAPPTQRLPIFEYAAGAQVHLLAPPASGTFYLLEKSRNQPLSEFVPDLCQRIADLDVLAVLGRRKNSKLLGLNGGSGTDSVPGHLRHYILSQQV